MQVMPCAVLSLFVHPTTRHHMLNRILWAFCVYLEAVCVLPQLRVMQNTKLVPVVISLAKGVEAELGPELRIITPTLMINRANIFLASFYLMLTSDYD
ncbi:hypothetical protein CR513_20337, partial [Mucuna pruriens]